mmetsp:Transcript_9592/g.24337  ORF Transcript_9592/g.24337 Transcript_9592/m.24337 type:complete len:207 (-) Transcript_9592:1561-2181(-)
MKAMATLSLRASPPLSSPAGQSSLSLSPTSCTAAHTASVASVPVSPLMAAYSHRWSRTLMVGHKMSNWGHRPRLRRISAMSLSMERPLTVALPLLAWSMPVRTEIVVVFPAPLCPSRAVIWPFCMSRLRSFTACLMVPSEHLNVLLNPVILMATASSKAAVLPGRRGSCSLLSSMLVCEEARKDFQNCAVKGKHQWRRCPHSLGST